MSLILKIKFFKIGNLFACFLVVFDDFVCFFHYQLQQQREENIEQHAQDNKSAARPVILSFHSTVQLT